VKLYIDKLFAVVGVISLSIFIFIIYLISQISNPPLFKYINNYDAIVILSGNPIRAEHGSKLFAQGKSKKIFLSREKAIIKNYLNKDNNLMIYELYFKILKNNNVPESSVSFFGEDNKSTYDEAKSLSNELDTTINSLLIVTNKYHIYRSNLIFKNVLPQKRIDFIFLEINQNKTQWWKDKHSIQIIFLETFKTMLFYLFGNFDNYILIAEY